MKQQSMIGSKISAILTKIQQARLKNNVLTNIRLVAVSKTKSVQQIMEAYDCGIRHFGQNYVDQMEEKQPKLPLDIKWHFIGHLQSNKIKKILVPNLQYIQTIDRQSLAEKINKQLEKDNRQVKILLQVKTSKEQTKSGVQVQQLDKLYVFIKNKCPQLIFKGLMTIGQQGDISSFATMNQLKEQMCTKYELARQHFQLSMGMSGDFELAIQNKSSSVRLGSSIFGERTYTPKK